jgi:hypothetical protein
MKIGCFGECLPTLKSGLGKLFCDYPAGVQSKLEVPEPAHKFAVQFSSLFFSSFSFGTVVAHVFEVFVLSFLVLFFVFGFRFSFFVFAPFVQRLWECRRQLQILSGGLCVE